jgi:DNA-binding NarL/FixJ family response regulator
MAASCGCLPPPSGCSPSPAARAPIPEELAAAARRLARAGAPLDSPRFTLSVTMSDGRPVDAELWLGSATATPRAVMARLDAGAAERRDVADLMRRAGLTQAEIKVLSHLAAGLSNGRIAARLGVSVETVRTHVKRILGKLGVESRLQAALLVNGRSHRWPRPAAP